MRVLHLVHRSWPYHGGSERYVLEHAIAAADRGHESTVFTTNAWDMSWFVSREGRHLEPGVTEHRGVRIERFPVSHPPVQNLVRAVRRRMSHGGPDRFFYPNPFVPALEKALRRSEGEFDLVHANAMPFALYLGYRYALRSGCPLVSVPHLNAGERHRRRRIEALRYFSGCQPRILRESNLVVAQSSFERDVYVDEHGVDPERVLILGSGIDPEDFRGANAGRARARFGLPEGSPVILSLTGHSLDRGSLDLLSAAAELRRAGMGFTLVLAGPVMEDFRRELRRLAPELSCESGGWLAVTGYIREEDRADLLAASDMVVQASRQDAFGIVLLDAWVSGSPVVACWCGGMPDIVSDGENGYLVPFGDRTTLAHRISLLLKSPEARARMADRGRRMVMEQRTWRRVTDRFYDRIEEIGGGAPA